MTANQQLPNLSQLPFGGLPDGITVKKAAAPLPIELQEALESARLSEGRYIVAVWTADEDGEIHLHRQTGEGFKFDWLLRSLAMLRNQFTTAPLPESPNSTNDVKSDPNEPVTG